MAKSNSQRSADYLKNRKKKTEEENVSSSNRKLSNSERSKAHQAKISIGFDTFSDDLNAMNTTLSGIHGGWQDADTMAKTRESISSFYDRLSAYEDYRKNYGTEEDELPDLSELAGIYKSSLDGWDDLTNVYGQYSNADAYDKAVKAFEEAEAQNKKMREANLLEENSELAYMESNLRTAREYEGKVRGANNRAKTNNSRARGLTSGGVDTETPTKNLNDYLASIGYSSIEDLESAIADKKTFIGKATLLQDNVKLSSVGDPQSSNYDKDFEKYVAKGIAMADETNGKFDPSRKNSLVYMRSDPELIEGMEDGFNAAGLIGKSLNQNNLFYLAAKYGNEDEINLYSYHLAKEEEGLAEKGTAERYLKSIEDVLKARAGGAIANEQDSMLDKYTFGVTAGVDQFTQGLINLANTEDYYIPVSPIQQASGTIRESIQEEHGFLGTTGYDLITTSSNMLPSILTSAVVSTVATPAVGAGVGTTLMGASASGNAYQEMLNLGYDKRQSRVYSTLVGVSEAGLQYALGGIGKLGGVSGKLSKAVSGIDNGIARFAIQYGGSMLSEGFEEAAQEVLTPLFKSLATAEDIEAVDWEQVAYSGLLGMLSGGMMEGPSVAINTAAEQHARKTAGANIRANEKIGETIDLASLSPEESSAYQAYTAYANKGINADNIKDVQLGRLATSSMEDALSVLKSKDSTPEQRAKAERVIQDLDAYTDKNSVSKYGREGVKALYGDEKSIKAYIDEGLESAEGTELRKLAEKFKAKLDKGKKLTTSEITQLVDATRDKVKGDIATTTEARLTELGEEGNVSEIAKIIAKRELGEKLTSAETEMLENSKIERKAVELAEATAGMSKEYADLFIENYNGKDDIEDYADSFELVRYYAEKGVDTDHVLEHKGVLTEAQALDIYKKAPKIQRTEQQKAIDKLVAKHSGKLSYKSVVDDSVIDYDNKGTEGKVNWNSLNSRQRQAITFAKGFAKGLGINLKFVTDGAKRGFNGKFVREENTLYIDVYAGIDQLEDGTWGEESIIPTLAHEITHWAKDKSPVLYAELSDKIFSALKMATGKSEIELIAEKRAELDGKGIKRNDAYARDEIIARACEDMLSMSEEGKKMFNSMSESEQKSFVAKIKELINDIVNWIDELLGSYKSDSREAKLLRDYKEELQDIAKTWDAMLVSAMDANAAMNAEGIFKDLHNGISEDGTTIIGESNVQMSEKTYRNGGRAFLVNWLETQSGLSDEDKADIIMQTDRVAEIMRAVAEGNELPDYSRWANMEVVKTESGEALSVIVNNGDYKLNIDFSQVCKKRVALDTVLNSMVQSGALDTHILSETDVAELNNIIKKHDFEIACALCFVDAKRYRVDAWADSFCNGVDEEVKKGVYKHKYGFNEMVRSLVPKGSGINVDEFNFTGRDIKNQPTKNLLSNAKDSQLDFSLIDEIMAKNDSKSAQHRYAKAIKENPAIRKILNHSEIISSIGLDKIRVESPAIYALINGHQGTAKPKFAHGGVAYGNNVLQAVNFTPESARMVGGVRCQSFSDFMANMVVDYAQFVSELSAKQLTAHSYTKEPLFVKLFGLTGMKINMSLVPKAIDMTPEQQEKFAILKDKNANKRSKAYQTAKAEYAKLAENAGLDENGNYIWEDETFPYDIAMDIVVDPRYSANCGTIAVGISDNHIRKLLADERISMVIPYHKSSLNYEVAVMRDIALYNDYTNVQNTRDSRTGKKLDKDKGQVDFNFYGDLYGVDGKEGTHDPRQTAQNYLDWCAENNYIPKFDTFKGDPNYYKLLIDFRVYDTDGTYREQQAVKPIYPEDAEFKDLILNGVKDKDGKVYGGLIQSQETSDRLKAETKQIVNEYRGVLKEKYGKDVLAQFSPEDVGYKNKIFDFGITQNEIDSYVEKSYKKENDKSYIKFLEVSDQLIEEVSSDIDLSGYAHALRDNDIRHIRNSHGEMTNEKYPVTQSDIQMIPFVIENYDKVFYKTNANKQPGLLYVKVMPENVIYYVEAITEEYGKEKLLINKQLVKTGINGIPNLPGVIEAINKKTSSSQYLADLEKIRKAYVQDVKENYSDNSILNSPSKSNEEIVNNEGEQLSERRRPITDTEYLELAKNPNRNDAKLRKIVDEEAIKWGCDVDKKGKPVRFYHGTNNFGFTEIDVSNSDDGISFFATDDLEVARTYVSNSTKVDTEVRKIGKKGEADTTKQGQAEKNEYTKTVNNVSAKRDRMLEFINKKLGEKSQDDVLDISGIIADRIRSIENGETGVSEEIKTHEAFERAYRDFVKRYTEHKHGKAYSWEEHIDTDEGIKLREEWSDYEIGIRGDLSTLHSPHGNKGIYEMYGKTDGFLEIDAMGDRWDSVFVGDTKNLKTRDIAELAKEQGYDGVKITNLFDDGGRGKKRQTKPATIYIFFNPSEQMKSADPVTYDDDGNVIPLFERFSEKNDIRYSERRHAPTAHEVMGELKTLENRYKKLEADYGRLKEKLKIEKSLTKGKLIVPSQVEAVARYLLKFGDSNYSKDELAKMLNDLYVDLQDGATNDSMTWDEMYSKAYEVAKEIRSEAKVRIERPAYYDMILKDIRSARIAPNEGQKGDAKHRFGDHYVGKFRGRVTIANDGTPLDIKWSEWASKYPSVFDKDIGDAQQLVELYDIYDDLRNAGEVVQEYEESEVLHSLATEIVNKAWLVTKYESTADKYDKRIKELNFEHRKAMDELKDTYKKKESDAKLLEQMYYGRLINDIKTKRHQDVARAKELGRERLAQYKENAEKNTRIQRITNYAKTLIDWYETNSKDKHIHDSLKGPVKDLILAIDFSSKQLLGMDGTASDKKYTPTKADISIQKSLDRLNESIATFKGSDSIVDEMKESGVSEKIAELLDLFKANQTIVGTERFVLNMMTSEELKRLEGIVKTVKSVVINANKFHVAHRNANAIQKGEESIAQLDARAKTFNDNKKRFGQNMDMLKSKTYWNNLNPWYAFKNMGEAAQGIFEAFMDGDDKFITLSDNVEEFAEKAWTAKESKAWRKTYFDFEITKPDGKQVKISMNVPQIMSLYCVTKQEDAKKHILHGKDDYSGKGITLTETKKTSAVIDNIPLTEAQLNEIIGVLDDKSKVGRAKEVADAIQEYMCRVGSQLGNEITMARWGIRSFGVENYFPIRVSRDTVNDSGEAPKTARTKLIALLNASFTHARNNYANNSAEIGDIFDVFSTHMSDMILYNSYALPLLDMHKWMNYKSVDEASNENSVRRAVTKTFGEAGWDYLNKFIEDVGGTTKTDSRDNIGMKFFRKAKVAKVANKLKVVFLQFTSFIRAGAVMDNKYLLHALHHVPKIKKAQENCGIARRKAKGYYDTDIARSLSENIKHEKSPYDKVIDVSLWGAGAADNVTMGILWNACELEIRDKRKDLKVGSPEFNEVVGKRLREVIYRTQVVDSLLTRSSNMRSKAGLVKMYTSFASEPTLSLNLALDTIVTTQLDARETGGIRKSLEKNGKYVRKAAAAYVVTAAVTAVMEAAFAFLYDYDDDEREENFGWDVLKNFVLNLSLTNKIPFVKEIWNFIQGYSSSNLSTGALEEVVKLAKEVFKLFQGDAKMDKIIKLMLQVGSDITGIAGYNLVREFKMIYYNLFGYDE